MSIDLDQLTALEQAATPGPWAVEDLPWISEGNDGGADAALIVAMRNALPELIEQVRVAQHRLGSVAKDLGMDEPDTKVSPIGLHDERWTALRKQLGTTLSRAEAAEARVAHLEAGIKALADEWFRMSVHEGKTLITTSEAHRQLFALLNGTDKDTE